MKSNCTSYSICLQSCSESDGQRDWFQTAAVRDVVNTVELQSVSECQFHMRSHDSVGAFLDCLPDWAQGLRHSQCSRWHTQNAVCTARLPINRTCSSDYL